MLRHCVLGLFELIIEQRRALVVQDYLVLLEALLSLVNLEREGVRRKLVLENSLVGLLTLLF